MEFIPLLELLTHISASSFAGSLAEAAGKGSSSSLSLAQFLLRKGRCCCLNVLFSKWLVQ
jgi:hypothetical protein